MLESTSRHLEASSAEDLPPRSWSRIVAAAESMAAQLFPNGSVALRVVGDGEIRGLNKKYRDVDAATDVLSFPDEDGGAHIGDIALSWDTTLRQAQANGNAPEDEAIALIAHGLLHLAGHDHDTDTADARMHAATLELLRSVSVEVGSFGH
jgi:probable rRNA maturation factor